MMRNVERQIFLTGIIGNLLLAVIKLGVGLLGYSKLVLMDGFFSLLLSQMFLFSLGGAEIDRRKATDKHPYGLGKALFLVLGVSACIALVVAIYMFIYGILMGWAEVHKSNSGAMMVTLISIIGNELLYRYLREKSSRIKNHVILINVIGNRIGVVVSSIIIVCVTLASLRYGPLEKTGVIIVSLILFIMSLRILIMVFGVIMDRIPSHRLLSMVEEYAGNVQGVKKVLKVKARHIGTWLHLEVMIAADESLLIGEANKIASRVENTLFSKIDKVKEVNVGLV